MYLHPRQVATTPGTVFQTNHSGQNTTWLILEFDLTAGRARYARLTEGSHVGTVTVECLGEGSGRTVVRVSYHLTSTTPAGTRLLQAMTEAAYTAMLQDWRRLILAARSPQV